MCLSSGDVFPLRFPSVFTFQEYLKITRPAPLTCGRVRTAFVMRLRAKIRQYARKTVQVRHVVLLITLIGSARIQTCKAHFSISSLDHSESYTHHVHPLFVSKEETVIGGHERGLRNGIQAGYGTCYCYSEKCFCEKEDVEGEL